MKKSFFMALNFVLAASLLFSYGFAAEKTFTLKVSTDSPENHHRNMGLKIFNCFLEKNSQDRIKVEFYHSAQLYKDRNIPKALNLGTVEMGVPCIPMFEGIEPNTAIISLPMFFGLPPRITKKMVDGELGAWLGDRLEERLDVIVLDKWYYHGRSIVCTKDRPIRKLEDWQGLKLRTAAGFAAAKKIQCLGASPVIIPFSDLPMAMIQGTADGTGSTFRSFTSTKLWETGVNHVTVSCERYLVFIPMISGKFWRSLPDDLKKVILDTWEQHINMQRAIAEFEQNKAIETIKEHNVNIYYPPDDELAKWRARYMAHQDEIIEKMKMDKAYVERVKQFIAQEMK